MLMIRVVLFVCLLVVAGCTQIRYALAPKKPPTLISYFGSVEAATAFFEPILGATVNVISGLPEDVIEGPGTTDPPSTVNAIVASGTVVDGGRHVLTAAHVLRRDGPYYVSGRGSAEGRLNKAELISCSRAADLAVLRPEKPLSAAVVWSRDINVGDTVFLLGLSERHSVGKIVGIDEISAGVVAVKHSAPIRGGDSGGPLLTQTGHLAAINTRIEFGVIRYAYSEGRRGNTMFAANDCFDEEL